MCIGIGGFTLIGVYLGYKLRQGVERVHAHRMKRLKPRREKADRVAPPRPEFLPMVQRTHKEAPPITYDSEREEVVLALTGAGYKKAAAAAAADACSTLERASLESWVCAALRRSSS